MIIGIIGSEGAKFIPETKAAALLLIDALVSQRKVAGVTSGACHLGGIDVWAERAAIAAGKPTLIHPPKTLRWEPDGYKARNIQIASTADEIHVITLQTLPPGFKGMRFDSCYHCLRRAGRGGVGPYMAHVKSGACWTAWYAKEKFNKPAFWHFL